ncbi:MAG: hypothetical protein ACFFDT_21190 [Candidatus Hodarchaeota archaeon]
MLKEDLNKKKDQLQFAVSKLRKLDNGIKAWERKFEHHKKLYNEQAKRFQDLKAKLEPQVQSLESQLTALENTIADLFICPYCSKEYKQKHHFDNHISKCKNEQNEIAKEKAELERLRKEVEAKQRQLDLKQLEETAKELDKEEKADIVENTKEGE